MRNTKITEKDKRFTTAYIEVITTINRGELKDFIKYLTAYLPEEKK